MRIGSSKVYSTVVILCAPWRHALRLWNLCWCTIYEVNLLNVKRVIICQFSGCKDKEGLLRLANQPYFEKGAQFMCGYCDNNYQICPLEKNQTASVEDYFTTISSIIATTHDFSLKLPGTSQLEVEFSWSQDKNFTCSALTASPPSRAAF